MCCFVLIFVLLRVEKKCDLMLQNYIRIFVCLRIYLLNGSEWILNSHSCHPEHAAYVTCKLLSGDILTYTHYPSFFPHMWYLLCRNEQASQQFGTQYMHEWCKMFLLQSFSHPHCEFSTTASCHYICEHRKNFQLSVLFPYWQPVSDSYSQLFHEKVSQHCADAYITTIATNVDILHVDYAKQTDSVSPLTEWQYG